MRIKCTLEGISPLLCNRFTEAAQEKVSRNSTVTFQGQRGTSREQAEPKLYLDAKGRPVLPTVNLMACLVEAGRFIKSGKSKLSTMRTSLVPAGIAFDALEMLLTPRKWDVDSRPVVIPSTSGRIICHRPRFDAWRISPEIVVDETLFSMAVVRELVDIGGQRIGLGDFRPSRRGPFGRFKVVEWKKG